MSKFNWDEKVKDIFEEYEYLYSLGDSESRDKKLYKLNDKFNKLLDKSRKNNLSYYVEMEMQRLKEEDEAQIRREEFLYY